LAVTGVVIAGMKNVQTGFGLLMHGPALHFTNRPRVASGVAVSVTLDPKSNDALHDDPQFVIPAGVELTVPCEAAVELTRRLIWNWLRLKFAVTLFAAFIVTVHAPEPEQSPDQLLNAWPTSGVGVTVTGVPGA
jgi:hypothetical protein